MKSNGKIGILVADDHFVVRMGLAALVKTEPGIEVVAEAADGTEAVGGTAGCPVVDGSAGVGTSGSTCSGAAGRSATRGWTGGEGATAGRGSAR